MDSQSREPEETRITELEEELKEGMARIRELERDRTTLQEQVEKLTADLKKSQSEPQQFPLESLASSFKALLENMQTQAIQPTPSGTAGALRSIDVELKGYINVQDAKTHLRVPRAGEAIDAQSLSLLKLSFVTVPTRPLPPKPPAPPPPKVPEQPPPKAPEQPPTEAPAAESAEGSGKRDEGRGASHDDG